MAQNAKGGDVNMPQFKVLRVYHVNADSEDEAVYDLKQWLISLQCREMLDVKLVFEKVAPVEEKEGLVKTVIREARDQIAGPKQAGHQAARNAA
jgi:hypothetical protein